MKRTFMLITIIAIAIEATAQTYSGYESDRSLSAAAMLLLILGWLLVGLIPAAIASEREVGFWIIYLISLILSPFVALLFAFASKHKSTIEYEKKSIEKLNEISNKLKENSTL